MSAPQLQALVHVTDFYTTDEHGNAVDYIDGCSDGCPEEWQCEQCREYFEVWQHALDHECSA